MVNELLTKQTIQVFTLIAKRLINPDFKFPGGGAAKSTVSKALAMLEKKSGALSKSRIVDYCICSAYVFKDRGSEWKINQVFGPKSIERFDTSKGRRHYEDQWLQSENITRGDLIAMIADKSEHPQAKYIYIASEEIDKSRKLNTEVGYLICQTATLGWSPESSSCEKCKFIQRCKAETELRYPELYRIRIEHGGKK